jgi:hypothetical protein
MAAQALRAVGLARSSADQLAAALELAVAGSASPMAARLMIELGRLRTDTALTAKGLGTLRALGDIEHLSRLQADR